MARPSPNMGKRRLLMTTQSPHRRRPSASISLPATSIFWPSTCMPVPVLPLVAPMRAQGDALEDTVMPKAALEPAVATSVSVNGATLPFSPKATKANAAPLPKLVAGGSPSEPLPRRGHRDSDVDASESPLASSPHHSMFRRLLRRTRWDVEGIGCAAAEPAESKTAPATPGCVPATAPPREKRV